MFAGALESNLAETSEAARLGTVVTASGTANTKGSYAELIASTGADCEGIYVLVTGIQASATDVSTLLDIATGAAASETVVVPDLSVGPGGQHTNVNPNWGPAVFIPISIASGTRIAARIQSATISQTAEVSIWLAQSIQHLEGASSMEAVGEDTTNSRGTSVTPGTNAWGSWTSIGSVTADRNVLVPTVDLLGDTTVASNNTVEIFQLGYGTAAPGSGGTAIDCYFRVGYSNVEEVLGPFPNTGVYADITSGDNIYVRVAGGSAPEARGFMALAMECPVASTGGGGRLVGV